MKKLLYMLLVMLPMTLSAQTTSENYIVTKVYKKETTTPINEIDKDQVSTTIQYFDGLGRAKQSIAIQAGGVLVNANELPIDWTLNNTGSTYFFNQNGSTLENKIVSGTTPFGNTDLLWECIPDATSNGDGGWNSDKFDIDNTKTYRYTVWVKRTGSQDGRTYHGVRDNISNLDNTINTNPYFWSGDLPQLDTWYLMVGIVHPYDYSGSDTGVSGVYDKNGNKVLDGKEYKWSTNSSIKSYFRNYLYYTTDTSVRQYFWSPLVQLIDGREIDLNELLSSETAITSQTFPKDIVTHFEYDEFGRQTKEYLPYATESNGGTIVTGDVAHATQTYYQQKYPEDFAEVSLPDVNAYSEKQFDGSPLNRVLQQAAPGEDWKLGNGHEIKFTYGTNTSEEVKVYEVTTSFTNNTYVPALTGGTSDYAIGELYKTITKDENHDGSNSKLHTTEEFKNKQGQVILKRTYALVSGVETAHDTYYVYDDFGNLTYVLPPKAEAHSAKPTTIELNELCYQYKYDYRNRLVEKKIPGKGWEYIVYDKLDRPVLTQDTNLKTQNKWLFTKYDILGRVIFTGIHTSGTLSRTQMQTAVLSNNNTAEKQYVSRVSSGSGYYGTYYDNTNYPNTSIETHTVNYYDDYIALPSGLEQTVTTSYGVTSTTLTKGLATVTKTRVLTTDNWITTVTYYDKKARPIYVYSKNDELQTTDIIESRLDFSGKVLETKTTHTKGSNAPIVTIDRFEYDHMDRLISQIQKINNQTSERIVRNNYDELGQLTSKLTGNGTKDGYKDVTSGISISHNIITKTGASGWDAGLATLGSFSNDGYVEFLPYQLGKYFMVGLSSSNINGIYNTIDYVLYCRYNIIRVYEKGINKGDFESFQANDLLKVERVGSEIHYKKNGKTFYISKTPSSGTLLGDISISTKGAKIKDFKIVDNSKGLQKVDYTYNVRGWLKNINQDGKNDNDLFNFSINYNKPQNGATALFNGNISETHWNTLNADTNTRGYSYKYDALNRLLSATGTPNTNYNVSGITYDKNGNIITLNRNGWQNSSSYANMDILSYEYHLNTNRLKNINDTGNANYGFKDGSELATEYTYDANGNTLTDANKNVTSVEYNHLNMPTEIKFNNSDSQKVKFVYAADGTKLRKVVNDNGTNTTTDYAEGFVYKNNVLKQFSHSEGYVEPNGSSYSYVYQYKDLQGNVRLSYTDSNKDGIITPSTEILREQNYYPFGLEHVGYNGGITGVKNNIKQFQGQEYHEELGLKVNEFKYRFYDPAYGRFWSIDPLAEDFAYNATYAFAENKLGLGKELEGRELLNNQMLFEAIRLGYEGYQNIKNNFTGGVEKVSQAHNEQMRQKIGTPDPNFDSESNRIEMAIGAGQVSKAVTDSGHLVADVAGTVDPSGIVDGVHALTYLPSGEYGNAALTGMGVLAYVGDGAKVAKYGDELADLGGAYGRFDNVRKAGKTLTEKNHLPTTKSYSLAGFKISKYMGSANIMVKADHRAFITTGSSSSAKAFRALEGKLLKGGKFLEAFDLNSAAIRKQFGNKYDKGIEKAREHYINEVIPKLQEQLK